MPFLPDSVRDKHVHVIGKTGYGKSTLLHWHAYKDIEEGKAIAVIDPKGDLVESLLCFIPEHRIKDCIWIDMERSIPLDFMGAVPGNEEMVVNDLKYILTKGVSLEHAHTVNSNVEKLLYTLLDANANPEMPPDERATFLDVNDFLEDEARKKFILKFVKDERLQRKWNSDFPNPTDRGRILTRMTPFVVSKTLRQVFGEHQPTLKISDIVRGKKVLLVKMPVESPSGLLYGSLIVAKIQQFMFSVHKAEDRVPFYLHIDEFQNFRASEAFERVLTMARGYLLCMTLANLSLYELDPQVRSALGSIYTYVVFRLNPADESAYTKIIGVGDPNGKLQRQIDKITAYLSSPDHDHKQFDPLLAQIKTLYERFQPLVDAKAALELSEFEAIYRIGNQPPVREPIPDRVPEPTPAQREKAQQIKDASYARYGPKSTGDKSGCNEPETVVGLGDGGDSNIQPSIVLPHRPKKGRS